MNPVRFLRTIADIAFENEGVAGSIVRVDQAPNSSSVQLELYAAGKPIGSVHDYVDGKEAGSYQTWSGTVRKTGPARQEALLAADFLRDLNWRKKYRKVEVVRLDKVGEEETYVVEKTARTGHVITEHYSTKSFLLLRREGAGSTIFSDYRSVGGYMAPFREVQQEPNGGRVVITVKAAAFDVNPPIELFRPKTSLSIPTRFTTRLRASSSCPLCLRENLKGAFRQNAKRDMGRVPGSGVRTFRLSVGHATRPLPGPAALRSGRPARLGSWRWPAFGRPATRRAAP